MPRYEFKFEQKSVERRVVTERRDVVIEADSYTHAQEAVESLECCDSSPIQDLELEEEYGDILGNDLLETCFGELCETDREADLRASDVLSE